MVEWQCMAWLDCCFKSVWFGYSLFALVAVFQQKKITTEKQEHIHIIKPTNYTGKIKFVWFHHWILCLNGRHFALNKFEDILHWTNSDIFFFFFAISDWNQSYQDWRQRSLILQILFMFLYGKIHLIFHYLLKH